MAKSSLVPGSLDLTLILPLSLVLGHSKTTSVLRSASSVSSISYRSARLDVGLAYQSPMYRTQADMLHHPHSICTFAWAPREVTRAADGAAYNNFAPCSVGSLRVHFGWEDHGRYEIPLPRSIGSSSASAGVVMLGSTSSVREHSTAYGEWLLRCRRAASKMAIGELPISTPAAP